MIQCSRCGKLLRGVPDGIPHYCNKCLPYMKQIEEARIKAEENKKLRFKKYEAWIDYLHEYEIVIADTPYRRQQGYEPFNFSNITPKGDFSNIVVFDTETTGLAPSRDRIIEIAAVRFVDGRPAEKFHSYVNPERHIPPEVIKINNITDDMVADAPKIGEILPSFDEFVGTSILVAHNLEFDLKFIFYSGSHVFDVKRKYIDTLEQARRFLKKGDDVYDFKLGTLCEYFDIPIVKAHNALADAFATGLLFYSLVDIKKNIRFVSGPPEEAWASKSLITLMETTPSPAVEVSDSVSKIQPEIHETQNIIKPLTPLRAQNESYFKPGIKTFIVIGLFFLISIILMLKML